jgi:hypothetical protein
MATYNAANWYWVVAGSTTQVYSSAGAGYVPATDPTYATWIDAGYNPTRIDSEASLQAVLETQYPAGWPASALKLSAQSALSDSDVAIVRCAEHGVVVNSDWQTYRAALRAIVAGTSDATSLPTKPAYQSGT